MSTYNKKKQSRKALRFYTESPFKSPPRLSKKKQKTFKRVFSERLGTDAFDNVLIVGGPRSGKDRFLLYHNLFLANSSYIVTDFKCEREEATKDTLLNKGYTSFRLDPINPDESNSYDPMRFVKTEEDLLPINRAMVNHILNAERSQGICHHELEIAAISIMIQELLSYIFAQKHRFSKIAELLDALIENEARTLAYNTIFSSNTLRIDEFWRSFAYRIIKQYLPPELLRVVNGSNPIDISTFQKEKIVCYVETDHDLHYGLLQMIFMQQAAYVSQINSKEHLTFVLAEQKYNPFNWQDLLCMRSDNVSALVFITHLDEVPERELENLPLAFNTTICLGYISQRNCEYLCRYLAFPPMNFSVPEIMRLPADICIVRAKYGDFYVDKKLPYYLHKKG